VRQLLGKFRTKDPGVTQRVFLAEIVRCSECQRTVPMGIEVVTAKQEENGEKILHHAWYCREHGLSYEEKLAP
jgi:hypothetical protein